LAASWGAPQDKEILANVKVNSYRDGSDLNPNQAAFCTIGTVAHAAELLGEQHRGASKPDTMVKCCHRVRDQARRAAKNARQLAIIPRPQRRGGMTANKLGSA
jgi:hypothetical protein